MIAISRLEIQTAGIYPSHKLDAGEKSFAFGLKIVVNV
jgi:hypothetical protein